ncbi:MAG: SMP-30/gluconolactonase/LRE family protein [Opitutae bacterium]|jgi:sugar lactone lactonase YvrE|nr:SMP-30/gluconolactonase/LRE family protein [Opitutae bacterium]
MNQSTTIQPVGSCVSQWGEGPIFWDGHLIYVDIEGHTLIRLNGETGNEETWEMSERIGTVVPMKDGSFLCAGDSGIYSFDPASGDKINLADPEAHKRPDNRFNDGKCDPAGRFWAGTISTVKKTGDANLYMFDLAGNLSLKVSGVTNSNGICWNAEATVMYYIDTPTKKILAYPFENETGEIGEPSLVVDTGVAGWAGSPDGMTIDADGKLWVAMCHGGTVLRIDPLSGELLQQVDFPCVETTACAFGGPNLERLFVTTGLHKTLDEPDAGKVFVVDGLGVSGVPSFAYGK